ncbi:TetR/AcrR family transcriptional regulator [Pseudonocardia sp. KRD-184]|uniref:TetR/AcrR family transcriptional regulator n=1 Tax=Pseudonocardia oceani TaxID=2792013 RepID=A0ABS6U3J7_9PSEU|nr:TetR/AcrR family transcriptional regulator [Pseudonocardia oceani]MBW0093170.1 TetR/AcrR family transcriptional regulator [Pseudonocardia oceani]MBW0098897.1 TetR/AcrR family transcriptional regulator [Pseudonocardia oceani]MBW0111902.1 TetR/AcrR family transcriptional regulator [Pseudonocardia oceani]MBW0124447.1 TetR/AcrR family transcriptional regulator [Pseudonocardia oceani]MBW0126804.1 TetR/AcrR family transcriptional regulator [Pseudonocardia oceani]
MPTAARERLLDAADRLFHAEGVRAVGVERLLAESGVGRASFYRHFPGKDDLVVAVLERRLARWREAFAASVESRGGGVAAVFEELADQVIAPGFRGCPAINAIIEAADPGSATHALGAAHKEALVAFLVPLTGDEERARQVLLLVDGALVTALREPGGAPVRRAGEIAAGLGLR